MGPTSGQTLEIWGFHAWGGSSMSILADSGLGGSDEGGSYCDIFEWSPA